MSDDHKQVAEVDEETAERRQKIADHVRFVTNAERWKNANLKPLSNFDQDYQAKAFERNTKLLNSHWMLQDKAEMEACKHAFIHGMTSGLVYGGVYGLGVSIYKR